MPKFRFSIAESEGFFSYSTASVLAHLSPTNTAGASSTTDLIDKRFQFYINLQESESIARSKFFFFYVSANCPLQLVQNLIESAILMMDSS